MLEIKLHNEYSCNLIVLNFPINLLINTLPFISKGVAMNEQDYLYFSFLKKFRSVPRAVGLQREQQLQGGD